MLPEKGNVEVRPKQFRLKCENLEIVTDGTAPHTHTFVDWQECKGVYSIRINFNTKRPMKLELGVFTKWFTFKLEPKENQDLKGKGGTTANG